MPIKTNCQGTHLEKVNTIISKPWKAFIQYQFTVFHSIISFRTLKKNQKTTGHTCICKAGIQEFIYL